MRAAIEYGSATPTRNENPGWMVSCSEHPAHSTCVWWYARKFQNPFPGSAFATRESCTTSAIISSMTKPRYVSTARLRAGFSKQHLPPISYSIYDLTPVVQRHLYRQ